MPTLFLRVAQWLILECARDISHKDISHLDEVFGKELERITHIPRVLMTLPTAAPPEIEDGSYDEEKVFLALKNELAAHIVAVQQNRKQNTNQPILSLSFGMRFFQEQTVGTLRSTYEKRLGLLFNRLRVLHELFHKKQLLKIPLKQVTPAHELEVSFAIYEMIQQLRPVENGSTYTGMAVELLRPTDLSEEKLSLLQEATNSIGMLQTLITRGRELVKARVGVDCSSYRALIETEPELHLAFLDLSCYLAGAALYDERILEERNGLSKSKFYHRMSSAHERLQSFRLQERLQQVDENLSKSDGRTVLMKTFSDIVQIRLEAYEERHRDDGCRVYNPIPLFKQFIVREIQCKQKDEDAITNIMRHMETTRNKMEKTALDGYESFIKFLGTLQNETQVLFDEFKAAELIDRPHKSSDRDCFDVLLISIIKYRIESQFKWMYDESWRAKLAATLAKPEVMYEKQRIASALYVQIRNGIEQLLDPKTSPDALNSLVNRLVLSIAKNVYHSNAVLIETKSLSAGQLQSLLSDVIRRITLMIDPPIAKPTLAKATQ